MNKSLQQLNDQFSIDDSVVIKEVENTDLVYIEIKNKFSSAIIHLQGAHLTSWTPVNLSPVIWLSEEVKYISNKSIRGGIPICWPWFGAHQTYGEYPAHGFARTVLWEIESIENSKSGETKLIFNLAKSAMLKAQWSFETEVKCVFTIGQTLEVELITNNFSQENIKIGEALHSYFNVSDVRNIIIEGLEDCKYLDKLENFNCVTQTGNIDIKQEVDRIYTSTDHECVIEDPGFNRRIRILKKGSMSTIVWNPWLETANKMADLGENGYLNMICVESGNAAQDSVIIKPNEKHSLYVQYVIDEMQ